MKIQLRCWDDTMFLSKAWGHRAGFSKEILAKVKERILVRTLCCKGAAFPSTQITRKAQGQLDLGGDGSWGMWWTNSHSPEKSKVSEMAGWSGQEQRDGAMAVLGVTCTACWLGQRMHGTISLHQMESRAPSQWANRSQQKEARRMPRVEEGVWNKPQGFTFIKGPGGRSTVMIGGLQRIQHSTHRVHPQHLLVQRAPTTVTIPVQVRTLLLLSYLAPTP